MSRILVITNNVRQASFRLRMETLIQPLAGRGLELIVQTRPRGLLERRRLMRSAAAYDAVILQRKLLDRSDARLLRGCGRRVFFDVDDAVMYDQPDAGVFARWRAWRRFRATAAQVDHVVAGNGYLAELFRRQGAKASVLPTVIDLDHYPVQPRAPATPPTLVWIGSRSTLAYLQAMTPALAQAAQRIPGLKLLVIADQTLQSPPLPTEHIPWSARTEAAALARGDIGIAPTPLNPWTQGKCGFKILQYMAAGLPTIASPVGANSELIIDGETGLLPAHDSDWAAAIARLAADPELRTRFGVAARRRVEQQYTLQRAVDFWAKLLHDS